jgi:mono/diheme cytochrome c family protein
MKKIFLLGLLILVISCQESNSSKTIKKEKEIESVKKDTSAMVEGYSLMKQKCFVCHAEKPDPAKKGQMIAPPISRIQEHYKPAYPTLEEFVSAISKWVKEPNKEKAMMPGAVRKFNLMPKMVVPDEEMNKIAQALYYTDFGNLPKMNKGEMNKLTLNNSKKWKVGNYAKREVLAMQKSLSDFKSENLDDYHILGKEIFDHAKNILFDKKTDQQSLSQMQAFLHNIEPDIHNLMSAKTLEEAEKEKKILQKKISKFNDYFE